jgi:hypothetical protein
MKIGGHDNLVVYTSRRNRLHLRARLTVNFSVAGHRDLPALYLQPDGRCLSCWRYTAER